MPHAETRRGAASPFDNAHHAGFPARQAAVMIKQACAPTTAISLQYGMTTRIADQERVNFSDRLKTALLAAGVPVAPTPFMRAYNLRADGAAVTPHAVRKWLAGEAIPTHEKIVILAAWLGVHAAWLRFGDAENADTAAAGIPPVMLSGEHLAMMNDIVSLPASTQQILREIVDAFVRNHRAGHLRSDKQGRHQ
ncbi:hypothetical protein ACFFXZ_14190 [Massilia antarctica]